MEDDEPDLRPYLRVRKQHQLMTVDFNYAYKLQTEEVVGCVTSSSKATTTATSGRQFKVEETIADEMAYYARQRVRRSDREVAELEAMKMREDESRAMHDQAFAREILNVPEGEWKKTGDHFQKPYVEKFKSTTITDWIKTAGISSNLVYCKGLVRETELIGGGNDASKIMRLVGVGVVIRDLSDRRNILEAQKPLELADIVDGECGDVGVEFKALIEGLNAAVTLGLQRVHVLFDNDLLYQYVKRERPARKKKIVTLVDEVSDLQKKFASCDMSLAGHKEVRFAFKLARDAIVYQATQHDKILFENCTICTEDTDVRKIFTIDNCLHQYCFSCMERHVEAKLLQGKLPECPHEGCTTEMKIQSCETFLTPELYGKMRRLMKEASVPVADKIYCPYPTCSALMSKREVRNPYIDHGATICMTCHGCFCVNCRVPWHAKMSCSKYKKKNPHLSKEDAKLKSLAKKSHWRQCKMCNHMVELAHGCYHIYCRCGYEFCYTCGAEWKNKKATCKCPIWNARNIVYT